MKDLEEYFNKINYSTILTTGRTGSDYLQGCLDNVPGVVTFSGKIFYYRFCDQFKLNNFEKCNPIEILELFIKNNIHLFTSEEIENKNIDIDIKKFKDNFNLLCKKKLFTRQKFLLALYLSYHLTIGRDIDDIKILVHHSHHVDETKRFLEDFKNSKLLITIRDPRANLKSGIVNWIKYDQKRDNQEHFYIYIKRIREDLNYTMRIKNEKFYIKLEEAGEIETKKKILSFLGIGFSEEIRRATFAGKEWKGDKLSNFSSSKGQYFDGVKNNKWQDFFTKKDKIILNFIYNKYKFFGYDIKKTSFKEYFFIFFLIPFPFIFDKRFFSLNYFLKKNKNFKEKIKEIIFYMKRIVYFYKLYFKLG